MVDILKSGNTDCTGNPIAGASSVPYHWYLRILLVVVCVYLNVPILILSYKNIFMTRDVFTPTLETKTIIFVPFKVKIIITQLSGQMTVTYLTHLFS